MEIQQRDAVVTVCDYTDLIPGAGVAVKLGDEQIAIFYLPGEDVELYAIDNHDPISGANILARGILGDVQGELVVASPIYKEHFNLQTGQCLESADHRVRTYEVMRNGQDICIRR